MKRPKKNPDLAQALADLRDWAWLEAKAEQTGTGQRQWLDVRDWAEGTALKYRVELPKPRPSIERRCSRTTPTRRPCPASSESPWKPIGELGEIAYIEDGGTLCDPNRYPDPIDFPENDEVTRGEAEARSQQGG